MRALVHGRRRTLRHYTCERCGCAFLGRVDKRRRYCSRKCSPPPVHEGAANNRYNGGLCFNQGRWLICCRDGTTMLYSRAVVAAELGRLLTPDEIVHHRNGRTDDDRAENLQVVTRAEHMDLHRDDLQRGRGL
jgi:hypothetical protein